MQLVFLPPSILDPKNPNFSHFYVPKVKQYLPENSDPILLQSIVTHISNLGVMNLVLRLILSLNLAKVLLENSNLNTDLLEQFTAISQICINFCEKMQGEV